MLPVITGVAMLLGTSFAARAQEPTAAGLWQKVEKGKPVIWVLMIDHDGTFEGVMARMFPESEENAGLICSKCTDDRKNAPVLGISFIRAMKRKGLEYLGGNVLDPRDGDIWKAKMTVSPDGQELTLRGYVLTPMLGKNETWYRLPESAIASVDPAIIAKYMPAQAVAPKPPVVTKKHPVPLRAH